MRKLVVPTDTPHSLEGVRDFGPLESRTRSLGSDVVRLDAFLCRSLKTCRSQCSNRDSASDTDTTDLVAVVAVGLELLAVFTPSEPELIVQTLIPLPPYHAPSGSVTMTVHAKGYLESLVVIFIMLVKSCLSIVTMEKTVRSVSIL